MRRRRCHEPLAWVGALVLWACSSPELPPLVAAPPAVITLGVGDVFEVRVFDEEELSGTYRVGGDGFISFPLVGRVQVEGLTVGEAAERLSAALTTYIRHPHVSILVKEYNSKKVYVLGEVKRPGTFPFEDGLNIIQVITLAGGFDRLANKSEAYVTRIIDGREQRIVVSVRDIGEGKVPNFELEPGDIVFVPEAVF